MYQLVDTVDFSNCVFLHVQLDEAVLETTETVTNVGKSVGLHCIGITPRETCRSFLRCSNPLISVIRFLPRNREVRFGSPSRFSISEILLEPSSSISNAGRARFSIFLILLLRRYSFSSLSRPCNPSMTLMLL